LRTWFNEHLITPARTKGLVYRGDEETEGLPNAAIAILNDGYIIRADIRGGDTWYELAHDRLVEPIIEANQRWQIDYFNPLAVATQVWLEAEHSPDKLLAGTQLKEAQTYADSHPLDVTQDEITFLADSHRQEEERRKEAEREARQVRRIRYLAIGTTIAAIIAIGLAVLAIIFSNRAFEAEAVAEEKAEAAVTAQAEAEIQARIAQTQTKLADQRAGEAEEATQLAEDALTEVEKAGRTIRMQSLVAQGTNLFDQEPLMGLSLALDGLALARQESSKNVREPVEESVSKLANSLLQSDEQSIERVYLDNDSNVIFDYTEAEGELHRIADRTLVKTLSAPIEDIIFSPDTEYFIFIMKVTHQLNYGVVATAPQSECHLTQRQHFLM